MLLQPQHSQTAVIPATWTQMELHGRTVADHQLSHEPKNQTEMTSDEYFVTHR